MAATFGLGSCVDSSFLDETATSDLSKEVIFADSAYTAGFLNQIYADIAFDVHPNRFGPGGLQSASDEGEFRNVSYITPAAMFTTGNVSAKSINSDHGAWKSCYRNIRRCNVFLANVDGCPMREMAKERYKAEARFLRAWYYHLLLRHYGGVPILYDKVLEDTEDIDMTRNSYEEVVDYIVSECNEAAKGLPVRRAGTDFGRASAGACYGLISRVKLYAASPLFNGVPTDISSDPAIRPLLGYESADQERWKEAATAALTVIGSQQFDLYSYHQNNEGQAEPGWGFYGKFVSDDYMNLTKYGDKTYTGGPICGQLFVKKYGSGTTGIHAWCDPARTGCSDDGGWPYLEIAESFPMLDGKAIDDKDGKYYIDDVNERRSNMLKNRDPRFNNTILCNGSTYRNGNEANEVCKTGLGMGATTDAIYTGTQTGFYWRKSGHRNSAANYWVTSPYNILLMHYSEILLNYAEATNEYYGPNHPDTMGEETITPIEALKLIRENAGIEAGKDNMYGLKAGMSQDEMREAIRLERRIELAFEGHRFYDVRRWKIAEQTENQMMHGLEINYAADGSINTKIVNVRQHVFRPAMYFWPLPYDEVSRSEELLQNPGY